MSPRPSSQRPDIEALLPRIKAMVAIHFNRVPPHIAGPEDLVQVGMEAVCKSAPRWRPEGGASFASFAHFRAYGAIQDFLRKQAFGGRHHHGEVELTSLDAPVAEDGVHSRGELIPGRFEFDDPLLQPALDRVLSGLPLDTQSAWELYIDEDLTLGEIADMFGVTESMVSHRIRAAREALAADPAFAEYLEAA